MKDDKIIGYAVVGNRLLGSARGLEATPVPLRPTYLSPLKPEGLSQVPKSAPEGWSCLRAGITAALANS